MYDISACLLTFNEETWIDLCIEHIYPFVSEIICLDSGSTDNTISILSKYDKVKYYIIPQPSKQRGCDGWNEGDRRNIIQDVARSNWVLCLGCDELIDDSFWELLPDLILNTDYIGFGFHRINYFYSFKYHKPIHIPKNAGEVRLYRNMPEIRWETKNAHNFLVYNGKKLYESDKVKNLGILIHHLHRVGIRNYKPVYDRRRPDSFIKEEDIIKSNEFIETSSSSYSKPIKLPSILKSKGLVEELEL